MRTWRRCARGAVAVEFVIIAPVFLMLLLGMVDFGMLTFEKMEVDYAAQAGARYALEYGWDGTGTSIANVIKTSTGLGSQITTPSTTSPFLTAPTCGCPGSNGAITLSSATCGTTCTTPNATYTAGSYLTVIAQTQYHFIVAWPGFANPLTVSASQTVRIN